METKKYYAANSKIVRKRFYAVVLLLLSASALFMPFSMGILSSPAGWILIILSAILIWFSMIIWRIHNQYADRKKPLLVVDADGIEITGPLITIGRIPWSEIESTYFQSYQPHSFQKIRYLCFRVKNPDEIANASRPSWMNQIIRGNMAHTNTPAFVIDDLLETTLEDIQLDVENRLYERREQREANFTASQFDVPEAESLRIANR